MRSGLLLTLFLASALGGCASPVARDSAALDAEREFHLSRDLRQEPEDFPGIPVDDADFEALPDRAAQAWRRLPDEGDVTFTLTREEAQAYYAELGRWAARAGVEDRWRFVYRDAYYSQREIGH